MMAPRGRQALLLCLGLTALLLSAACGREVRDLAETPRSAPRGEDDPRIPHVDLNAYQIGQGGRYAAWYGCPACHGAEASGVLDLRDGAFRYGSGFRAIYDSIAERHPGPGERYGTRVPVQQLWQIAAYVRSLESLGAARARRQDLDQAAEPQGAEWRGPLR